MIFVIPAFRLFSNFGADPPAPTVIVINMSDFSFPYWWAILQHLCTGSVFLKPKRSASLQVAFDKFMLRAPVMRGCVRKATIARWTLHPRDDVCGRRTAGGSTGLGSRASWQRRIYYDATKKNPD